MLLIKKTINLKTVYLISDVFFHKKMSQNLWATIMPFGPVTLIFDWPKKKIQAGPQFRHCWLFIILIIYTIYYFAEKHMLCIKIDQWIEKVHVHYIFFLCF